MARLTDLPERSQANLSALECPSFTRKPFVAGPRLQRRKIVIISSAGLVPRGGRPFVGGEADYREIPRDIPANDLLMSHISVNFDRTGYQQDINVVFPRDRLLALSDGRQIGPIADRHYSFMGATDPVQMEAGARELAGRLRADQVTGALLLPV